MSAIKRNRHKLMNGSTLAHKIINRVNKIINRVREEIEEKRFDPRIAAIIVNNNPTATVYQRNQEKRCVKAGIRYSLYQYKHSDLLTVKTLIKKLNKDPDVTGIVVQFPLPKGWDEYELLESIASEKDIAGLNLYSVGKFCYDSNVFVPCIAEGLIRLFMDYKVEIEGKIAVVLGNSREIGTPIAQLLEKEKAFVTKLPNFLDQESVKQKLKTADIVISSTGKRKITKGDMMKEGVVAIDCANSVSEREFYDDVFDKASLFSTIPASIGPILIAILIENVLKAYKLQRGI